MSEPREIPLKDFEKWLEQETVVVLEPLEAEAKGLLGNIEDRLKDVEGACEKLLQDAEKEIQKGSRKTYRRSRVAHKLAGDILNAIDKTTIPTEFSYESLQAFFEDLEKNLSTMDRERARWFPRISPYFIIDRRRVDLAVKRALDSFGELETLLTTKYTEAKKVQDSMSMTSELRNMLGELERINELKQRLELRGKTIEKRIADGLGRRESIQSRRDLVELDQAESTTEELRKEVRRSLRHLQKPFLKFQNLVQGPGYPLPLDEVKKLSEYLSDPFEALATEQEGYPVLKAILAKMEDAFAKEKLKLKASRFRKAIGEINNVLRKGALAPLQQRCRDAHSLRVRLSTSDAITTSQDKLAKIQQSLRNLQKKKKLHDSRRESLEEELSKTQEAIEDRRKDLEKLAFELTGKNVSLILEQS